MSHVVKTANLQKTKGYLLYGFFTFHRSIQDAGSRSVFSGHHLSGAGGFVIAIICWLFWCSNKNWPTPWAFLISSQDFWSASQDHLPDSRPWILDPAFAAVPSALAGATGYSFPSGHTQSITALFEPFALHAKKWHQKLLCAAVIVLVGFSRMYLGVHTPKDVLTSFFLSIGCTLVCYVLFYRKEAAAGREALISLLMAVMSAALVLYAAVLYQNSTIELHYAQDCIKASGAGMAFALGYYVEQNISVFRPCKDTPKSPSSGSRTCRCPAFCRPGSNRSSENPCRHPFSGIFWSLPGHLCSILFCLQKAAVKKFFPLFFLPYSILLP